MEGRGNVLDTVLITPRPLRTRLAFPVSISPKARRVLQILIGSKFAFNTNTGSCMVSSATFANYSTGSWIDRRDEREGLNWVWEVSEIHLFLDPEIDL